MQPFRKFFILLHIFAKEQPVINSWHSRQSYKQQFSRLTVGFINAVTQMKADTTQPHAGASHGAAECFQTETPRLHRRDEERAPHEYSSKGVRR